MRWMGAVGLAGLVACGASRMPVPTDEQLADPHVLWQLRRHELPLVEGEEALFVIEVAGAKAVQLVGDFTDWEARPVPLSRAGDVWFCRLRFDPRARLEYQFLVDGKWKTDPLNPRTVDNGVGGVNSWFGMPLYRLAPPRDRMTPRGRVEETRVGGHDVWVYVPHLMRDGDRFPVQYFQDGRDYLRRAEGVALLDALIAARKISPLIAVFVAPVDRGREYGCDAEYVRFFVDELVAWVDGRYPTRAERESRGLMGASLGALISVHLAYERPDLFGRVASQSGAFHSEDRVRRDGTEAKGTGIFDRIRAAKAHPVRFYVTAGIYEGLLEQNRSMRALLGELGVAHAYGEHPHGHTWTFWKETLEEALVALWGGSP